MLVLKILSILENSRNIVEMWKTMLICGKIQ